jgi:hypothetical protein
MACHFKGKNTNYKMFENRVVRKVQYGLFEPKKVDEAN